MNNLKTINFVCNTIGKARHLNWEKIDLLKRQTKREKLLGDIIDKRTAKIDISHLKAIEKICKEVEELNVSRDLIKKQDKEQKMQLAIYTFIEICIMIHWSKSRIVGITKVESKIK